MPRITLEAQNFRGLRHLSWSPSGVCALVGPTGSGKTTVLRLFEFLHNTWWRGLPSAVDAEGGAWGLRHFNAGPGDAISCGLIVAERGWGVLPRLLGASVDPRSPEQVTRQGMELPILRESFGVTFGGTTYSLAIFSNSEPRLLFPRLYENGAAPDFEPLAKAINSSRVYRDYSLPALRQNGSRHSSAVVMSGNGDNAFTVLRNWHARKEHKPRYDFVLKALREAFPEICDDMDFDYAGVTNSVRMHLPGTRPADGVLANFTPNGWLMGLLHLCAVAGAEPGSLVAIDEVENSLHPFAIRKLIEAFREWAEEHDLTICLATHSPMVLDQFKEEPENVFVMEPGQPTLPVRLTDLNDPEWLAQFSLGDLYTHGEFGSPPSSLPKPEPAK